MISHFLIKKTLSSNHFYLSKLTFNFSPLHFIYFYYPIYFLFSKINSIQNILTHTHIYIYIFGFMLHLSKLLLKFLKCEIVNLN